MIDHDNNVPEYRASRSVSVGPGRSPRETTSAAAKGVACDSASKVTSARLASARAARSVPAYGPRRQRRRGPGNRARKRSRCLVVWARWASNFARGVVFATRPAPRYPRRATFFLNGRGRRAASGRVSSGFASGSARLSATLALGRRGLRRLGPRARGAFVASVFCPARPPSGVLFAPRVVLSRVRGVVRGRGAPPLLPFLSPLRGSALFALRTPFGAFFASRYALVAPLSRPFRAQPPSMTAEIAQVSVHPPPDRRSPTSANRSYSSRPADTR